MKLKTLNAHPSLFFDIRALVEKVRDAEWGKGRPEYKVEELAHEAQAILEKCRKLEER